MDIDEKGFKLADNFIPPLFEGKYSVTFNQTIQRQGNNDESEEIEYKKDFCVAVHTERLPDDSIFSIYPLPEQQGVFSNQLPFMVLNDPSYPWAKKTEEEIPWVALIVLSENEIVSEEDIKYSDLSKLKEENNENVFFPYEKNDNSLCKADDIVHVITVERDIFESIIPSKDDRRWLSHCKYVDLSATDDKTSEKDGYFSTIVANRFPLPPFQEGKILKNTVHLIAAYLYDDIDLNKYDKIKMISIYHWNIYSDKVADKSFVSLAEGLKVNSKQVMDVSLKPHYLRTGEKTYSLYHAPVVPAKYIRSDKINGEEKYTSDGRLIYDMENGIFDVSYSSAFNLGRLVSLSHTTEAQQIVSWRKRQRIKEHISSLETVIGVDNSKLTAVIKRMKEGNLK